MLARIITAVLLTTLVGTFAFAENGYQEGGKEIGNGFKEGGTEVGHGAAKVGKATVKTVKKKPCDHCDNAD